MTPTLLLVGPSQIGKDSLIRVLVLQHGWHAQVNMTTRAPRAGEIDGVDYRFVDVATFQRLILTGSFIDWDYTAGSYYGIPVGSEERAPALMHCLSRIAIRLQVRTRKYASVLLLPKSIGAHRERIMRMFPTERAAQRLAMFEEDLAHASMFQRVIHVKDFASSKDTVDRFLKYAQELM